MVKIRIDSTTPKVRERTPTDDFVKRAEGMTHEQMVTEYRKTSPGDPWGDFLGWAISQQKPGETAAERDKRIGKGPVSTVPKGYSALSGFADVSNYGFMDEAAAALDALLGKRSYDEGLANARMNAAEARSANPKSYTAGQIGGGVPLAAQAMLMAPAAGARTLGGLALTGAAEGAAQGGLYGVGSGVDAKDRLWQGLQQALAGAFIGGLAPFGGRAFGAMYRGAKNAILNSGTGSKATQSILKMLQENGLTPDAVRSALDKLGPEGMLADVSPGMQVEAAGTAAASPAGAEVMSPRLASRNDGMGGRVTGYLDEGMGKFQDPQAISDSVAATKKSTAPAYDLAKEHVVDPEGALAVIRREMKTYGPNSDTGQALAKYYSQLVDGAGNVIGEGNKVHGVRQEIDAALRGGSIKNAAPLRAVRDELDKALKTQIPGFAEADKTWSGAQRLQEAFDYGQQDVLGQNIYPGQFQKKWGAMSEPEKTATRMGARAKLEMSTISGAPNPGMRLERQLEKNMNDQKIGPMVEAYNPGAYPKLKDRLNAETTFRETNDLVQATRGSRTAPVTLAAQNRWGIKGSMDGLSNALGNAATAAAAGGPQAGIFSLVAQGVGAGARGLSSWVRAARPEVIQKAADMLTRQGPGAQEALGEVVRMLRATGVTQKEAEAIARGLSTALKSQAALGSAEIRGVSPNGGSGR